MMIIHIINCHNIQMLYTRERILNFKHITNGIVLKQFRVELVYILLFIMAIFHKCTLEFLPYMQDGAKTLNLQKIA